MKILIPLLLVSSFVLTGQALAQDPYPPQAPNPTLAPMQPQFPFPGAGPGMSYGQQYVPQGYTPGMGQGSGWRGGRNYRMPEDYRGYYRSGPGIMMGQGMTQFGMGPGMIRGIGVMGYIPSESFQKFFKETRDLRKELNGLMFDYAEMLREPKQDPGKRIKLEGKIMALRQKVYDKAPRYQWPFE